MTIKTHSEEHICDTYAGCSACVQEGKLSEQDRIIEIIRKWWKETMQISSTSTRLQVLINQIQGEKA